MWIFAVITTALHDDDDDDCGDDNGHQHDGDNVLVKL